MIFTDQLQRELSLKEIPKRIVSLVPSQTELLIDLGLEEAIVGITKFCVHPNHLRSSKTVVGGTKQVKLEKIKNLQPDIILCNKEENSKAIIKELEGVAPIHISDIYNIDDCFELIKMYGDIFKVEDVALSIIGSIQKERSQFQNKLNNSKKVKVAYFVWKQPWMVAASNTFINCMIKEAGFFNIFDNELRYPEIDLSHPKLKIAEEILLSSEPFPFKQKHVQELMRYFPKKSVKIIDGEMFSWYGSRLERSYTYFESLYK